MGSASLSLSGASKYRCVFTRLNGQNVEAVKTWNCPYTSTSRRLKMHPKQVKIDDTHVQLKNAHNFCAQVRCHPLYAGNIKSMCAENHGFGLGSGISRTSCPHCSKYPSTCRQHFRRDPDVPRSRSVAYSARRSSVRHYSLFRESFPTFSPKIKFNCASVLARNAHKCQALSMLNTTTS